MKTFNLTFEHPVKGRVILSDSLNRVNKILCLETDSNFILKIPLKALSKGRWTITFEWEYNGRDYDWQGEIIL